MFKDSGYVKSDYEPKHDPYGHRFSLRTRIGGWVLLVGLIVSGLVWLFQWLASLV